MFFPIERYADLQGWIPTEDAHGSDLQNQFVEESENIDFENGFWAGIPSPSSITLPAGVQTEISDNGYTLLSARVFRHIRQGEVWFYVLYKFSDPTHLLKFFVIDSKDDTLKELNIDEQNDSVTFKSKPSNINYAVEENQLKINLNILIDYNGFYDHTRTVVGNLTLWFQENSSKSIGDSFGRPQRSRSWYLFPRWLGWSWRDNPVSGVIESNTFITHDSSLGDKTDGHGETQDFTNMIHETGRSHSGVASAKFGNDANVATYEIANIDYASGISFYWMAPGWGWSSGYTEPITGLTLELPAVQVVIKDDITEETIKTVDLPYTESLNSWEFIEIDFPTIRENVKVVMTRPTYDSNLIPVRFPHIDDIEIDYRWKRRWALVGVNEDQQRFLMDYTSDEFISSEELTADTELKFYQNNIDWRLSKMELYLQQEQKSNVYIKVGTVYVYPPTIHHATFTWASPHFTVTLKSMIQETPSWVPEEPLETLNFNYGLGHTVDVDLEDFEDFGVHGRYIHDEAFFRGRAYTVKRDEKVYFSHISGTGRPQPDSFPYNDEVDFGFFVTDDREQNVAIASSSLDEFVVNSIGYSFVYYVQYSGQGILRKLKYINGGNGAVSSASMTTNGTGLSTGQVLLWADTFGLYMYGGGARSPKRITDPKLRNYWNKTVSKSSKETSIGFYNRTKDEYWLQVGNEVIIYEVKFDQFKRLKLNANIITYCGQIEDVPYVLMGDNRILKVDPSRSARLSGFVTTHYNSNTRVGGDGRPVGVPEIQDKILQELYLTVMEAVSPGYVKVTPIADNITYNPIYLDTSYARQAIQSPLLIRYGKIKFKIEIFGNIRISEFGYGFVVPEHPYSLHPPRKAIGLGMIHGGEHGVVL